VTTITSYTFTQLTFLTRQSSILSERLVFTWRLPTAKCLSCLQDNPFAQTTENTQLPVLLRLSGNMLHSNGHGTDPQKTSYVLAVTCLSVRYLAIHVTILIYSSLICYQFYKLTNTDMSFILFGAEAGIRSTAKNRCELSFRSSIVLSVKKQLNIT
jgi:hypothetical protein